MTNDQAPMTKKELSDRPFNLAERTADFGERTIRLVQTVRRNPIVSPLISQLVRAATSIGANYVEADEAGSKKEFRYRISLCRREARETQYWLRMISTADPTLKDPARRLWTEARELVLILETIHRKSGATPK
jgi:four helix bundle protein